MEELHTEIKTVNGIRISRIQNRAIGMDQEAKLTGLEHRKTNGGACIRELGH